MKKIRCRISEGGGSAIKNLRGIKNLIQERMGLPALVDGTLNTEASEYYPITALDDVITPEEYNHQKECIKLKRCRINGLKGVIIRPSQHDDPHNKKLWLRIEIMSHHHFKQELNLNIGDEVKIEVESGTENEDDWWNAPENNS